MNWINAAKFLITVLIVGGLYTWIMLDVYQFPVEKVAAAGIVPAILTGVLAAIKWPIRKQ